MIFGLWRESVFCPRQKVAEGKFVYFHPSPKAGSGVARTTLHFIVSEPSGHVIFRFRSAELRDAIRVRSAFPKLSAIHSKRTKSVPRQTKLLFVPAVDKTRKQTGSRIRA